MKTTQQILAIFIILFSIVISTSCKKEEDEHVMPDLQLKSGGGYISANTTLSTSTSITFGIKATKTEDELKTVNISRKINNGASVSIHTYTLSGSDQESFNQDYSDVTQSSACTEKWIITVTDVDGNINSKTITLTVN